MKLKLVIKIYSKHVKTYFVQVDPNTLCSGVLAAIAKATSRYVAAAFSRAAIYTKRGRHKVFHIKEIIRVAADPIQTIGKYLTGDHKNMTSDMIFAIRVFTITLALAISRPFAQLFDPMIFTCNEELDALQAIQLASDALVDLVPYFTSMHTCDDEVPRPVKRARTQPEEEEKEESSAIVPFGGGDAKSLILPYLHWKK